MIVVALAALAYTWFTGIFAGLTESTGTAVTQTTTGMGYSFTIENAYCEADGCGAGNDCIRTTIRNTGTEPIDASGIQVYIDNDLVANNAGGTIAVGGILNFNSGTGASDAACGTADILKVTIGSGLEQTAKIN